jgi:hypothetical protein
LLFSSVMPPLRRRAEELPWVLERAGRWQGLRRCLMQLDLATQLWEAPTQGDTLRYWARLTRAIALVGSKNDPDGGDPVGYTAAVPCGAQALSDSAMDMLAASSGEPLTEKPKRQGGARRSSLVAALAAAGTSAATAWSPSALLSPGATLADAWDESFALDRGKTDLAAGPWSLEGGADCSWETGVADAYWHSSGAASVWNRVPWGKSARPQVGSVSEPGAEKWPIDLISDAPSAPRRLLCKLAAGTPGQGEPPFWDEAEEARGGADNFAPVDPVQAYNRALEFWIARTAPPPSFREIRWVIQAIGSTLYSFGDGGPALAVEAASSEEDTPSAIVAYLAQGNSPRRPVSNAASSRGGGAPGLVSARPDTAKAEASEPPALQFLHRPIGIEALGTIGVQLKAGMDVPDPGPGAAKVGLPETTKGFYLYRRWMWIQFPWLALANCDAVMRERKEKGIVPTGVVAARAGNVTSFAPFKRTLPRYKELYASLTEKHLQLQRGMAIGDSRMESAANKSVRGFADVESIQDSVDPRGVSPIRPMGSTSSLPGGYQTANPQYAAHGMTSRGSQLPQGLLPLPDSLALPAEGALEGGTLQRRRQINELRELLISATEPSEAEELDVTALDDDGRRSDDGSSRSGSVHSTATGSRKGGRARKQGKKELRPMLSTKDFSKLFSSAEMVGSSSRSLATGSVAGIAGSAALFHTGMTSLKELIRNATTLEARRDVVRAITHGLAAHSQEFPVTDYEVQIMMARARTMMLRAKLDALRAESRRRRQELDDLTQRATSDVGSAGARASAEMDAALLMVSALEDRLEHTERAIHDAHDVRVFFELVIRQCEQFPAQDPVYLEQAQRALRLVNQETQRMATEESNLLQEARELERVTIPSLRDECDRAATQRSKLIERLQAQRERQVELVKRGVQRERRRLEIANQVAGDLGEAEEQQLRLDVEAAEKAVLLARKRLEERREALSHYTHLFERIKETTGVNEAAELIRRHQQRGEIQRSLEAQLNSYDIRLRELHREISTAEEEKHDLEVKAAEVSARRLRELEEEVSRELALTKTTKQKLTFAKGVLKDMRAGASHMCNLLGVSGKDIEQTLRAARQAREDPSASSKSRSATATEERNLFSLADRRVSDEDVPELLALAETAAMERLRRLASAADDEAVRAAEALGLGKAAGFARVARGSVKVTEEGVRLGETSSSHAEGSSGSSLEVTRAAARILGLNLTDQGHLLSSDLHQPSASTAVHVPADIERYRQEVKLHGSIKRLGEVTGLSQEPDKEASTDDSLSDLEPDQNEAFAHTGLSLSKPTGHPYGHGVTTPAALSRGRTAASAARTVATSAVGVRDETMLMAVDRKGSVEVAPLPTQRLRRAPDSRRDPQVQALLSAMLPGDPAVEKATQMAAKARREARAGRAAAAAAATVVTASAEEEESKKDASRRLPAVRGRGRLAAPIETNEVVRDLLVARGMEASVAERAIAGSPSSDSSSRRRKGSFKALPRPESQDGLLLGSGTDTQRARKRQAGEHHALATASLYSSTELLNYASVPSLQAVLDADKEVVDRRALKEVAAGIKRSMATKQSK